MNAEMYAEWLDWIENTATMLDLMEALATRQSLIQKRPGNEAELRAERRVIVAEIDKRNCALNNG